MNEKLGRGEVFDQSEAKRLINGVIIALINRALELMNIMKQESLILKLKTIQQEQT